MIFIEKPLHIQNGETTIKMSIAASAIFFAMKARGFNTEFININTWKKWAIGKGNANKEMVKEKAMDTFPNLPDRKVGWDIYDASLIAYAGLLIMLEIAMKEEE
jgi:Holliday junction resolvasome RuvABC endonuclease subunit